VGVKAGAIIDGGGLVPDDLMARMVRERFSAADVSRGFLLDGYPRTLDQGVTLESILGELGWKLDHVLYLAVEDAEIVKRISGRRTCGACGTPHHIMSAPPRPEVTCAACGGALVQRPDDREDVVVRRLKLYRDLTEPLAEFYRRRGLLREIDATGSIKDVENRLAAAASSPAPSGPGSPS
jgi:adenylate kinase